jgi:hypothetical protein
MYVSQLRDRGVTQGHVLVHFHKPVSNEFKTRVAEAIGDVSVPLARYPSFMNHPIDTRDAGTVQLT